MENIEKLKDQIVLNKTFLQNVKDGNKDETVMKKTMLELDNLLYRYYKLLNRHLYINSGGVRHEC